MSAFFPEPIVRLARENCARHAWAAEARSTAVKAAEPWMTRSMDELWDLMFGHTITRSWMVWSNGFCPSCRKGVPMYQWRIEPLALPWKVRCPHCDAKYPTNDFAAYHRSGLDGHRVFDPAQADRSLLFNADHPDPADPLRLVGVDDGEGYEEGGNRWRFIGAYLIYGQWKRDILAGIDALSGAWLLTGEREYARGAIVLLDRVADLYGTFDFEKEGLAYERGHGSGYVSTWHDACGEARNLALAWDRVRDAVEGDAELVSFLSRKAREAALSNPKASAADIRWNIDDGILADSVRNRKRITSNFPQTDVAVAVIQTVLGFPNGRAEVDGIVDSFVERSTAVDGVTGEKGMAGYASFAVWGMAQFLGLWGRAVPGFLPGMLARHPRLRDHFRFHLDTWCLQAYYPSCGDSGSVGEKQASYVGVGFPKSTSLEPSGYTLLRHLASLTGDDAFLQACNQEVGGNVDRIPLDLFLADPEEVRTAVATAVARSGTEIRTGSVNKEKWRLAILRSGTGRNARAAWLDYDNDGNHRHADGMSMGLYAFGLDLMSDFGYPPVNYGGWYSPRAMWYKSAASHCTLLVDRKEQEKAAGACTLWMSGGTFQAVRASCPELYGAQRLERTVALVDAGDGFYLLDLFRAEGGSEHLLFGHSQFASIVSEGVPDAAGEGFDGFGQMRAFRGGPASPGWSAEWRIRDRLGYLPEGADVRVRRVDLTEGAEAYLCEAWVSVGGWRNEEAWIPRVIARRAGPAPLSSTFVSVTSAFDAMPAIAGARRLPGSLPGGAVAVEVALSDGKRDVIVSADGAEAVLLPEQGLRFRGDTGWIRLDPRGGIVDSLPRGAWSAS